MHGEKSSALVAQSVWLTPLSVPCVRHHRVDCDVAPARVV